MRFSLNCCLNFRLMRIFGVTLAFAAALTGLMPASARSSELKTCKVIQKDTSAAGRLMWDDQAGEIFVITQRLYQAYMGHKNIRRQEAHDIRLLSKKIAPSQAKLLIDQRIKKLAPRQPPDQFSILPGEHALLAQDAQVSTHLEKTTCSLEKTRFDCLIFGISLSNVFTFQSLENQSTLNVKSNVAESSLFLLGEECADFWSLGKKWRYGVDQERIEQQLTDSLIYLAVEAKILSAQDSK